MEDNGKFQKKQKIQVSLDIETIGMLKEYSAEQMGTANISAGIRLAIRAVVRKGTSNDKQETKQ